MRLSRLLLLVIAAGLFAFGMFGRGYWHPAYVKAIGKRTVADVIHQYGPAARSRLKPYFEQANVSYPPKKLAFLTIKDTDKLEVWASDDTVWKKINTYPVLAASGKAGPKLREGDRQVPEGIYRITGLNPNSAYHLSMRLDYPNRFDLTWAKKEGRTQPGSNIFIHGKAVSIGCLAMGDPAIEELFVLTHDVGLSNIQVLIAPTDPRAGQLHPPKASPPWVNQLYAAINKSFKPFSALKTSQW